MVLSYYFKNVFLFYANFLLFRIIYCFICNIPQATAEAAQAVAAARTMWSEEAAKKRITQKRALRNAVEEQAAELEARGIPHTRLQPKPCFARCISGSCHLFAVGAHNIPCFQACFEMKRGLSNFIL